MHEMCKSITILLWHTSDQNFYFFILFIYLLKKREFHYVTGCTFCRVLQSIRGIFCRV